MSDKRSLDERERDIERRETMLVKLSHDLERAEFHAAQREERRQENRRLCAESGWLMAVARLQELAEVMPKGSGARKLLRGVAKKLHDETATTDFGGRSNGEA